MDAPPVQFVTTTDGWNIAYAVSGAGQPVVFIPGHCDHVQLAWRYPGLSDWLEQLSRHFLLVQFDPRGAGMSGRGLPDSTSETDYMRDIEAVVERLGLDNILFVTSGPGPSRATRFAIEYPSKVAGIVVASTPASRDE